MRSMLMGRASSFAHFTGFGGKRRADDGRPEDDKASKRSKAAEDDPEDEDEKKDARRAEDDPAGDDGKEKGKRSKAAEDDPSQYPDDDDDPPTAEGDDEDERCEDDDDEEEMRGKSATARARRREQARCRAIFAHPAAAENIELACSLAFDTRMPRQEAIAVLKGQANRPAPRRAVGAGREARNADLGAGGSPSMSSSQAIQGSWASAFTKIGTPPKGR